jgi:uncharacterized protein (DUF1697 family)
MQRYIALLRGINISGKNKIPMVELKKGFVALGFAEVATYLNSGNVVFSSVCTDTNVLVNSIESMIKDTFDFCIPVFIISQAALSEHLRNAPAWWGDESKEIYDNLIFLMPPLSYEAFYNEMGQPKAEYEKAQNDASVVFWSFSRKDYQKTNWWSKTANSGIRDRITIRTANTVRKIVGM